MYYYRGKEILCTPVRVVYSIRRQKDTNNKMSELQFSSTLYKLYHTLAKLEENELKDNKTCKELTVNELNLIECIRSLTKKSSDGPTISDIASELDITRPSTTVAVNKLCSKDFAVKNTSMKDGRSVLVKLTEKGEKAYNTHHTFQNTLMKTAKQEMSEEEFNKIRDSLNNLTGFLDKMASSENNK